MSSLRWDGGRWQRSYPAWFVNVGWKSLAAFGPKSDVWVTLLSQRGSAFTCQCDTSYSSRNTHTYTHTRAAGLSSDRRLAGHLIINWLPGGWRQRAGSSPHTSCGRASRTVTEGRDTQTDKQMRRQTAGLMDRQKGTEGQEQMITRSSTLSFQSVQSGVNWKRGLTHTGENLFEIFFFFWRCLQKKKKRKKNLVKKNIFQKKKKNQLKLGVVYFSPATKKKQQQSSFVVNWINKCSKLFQSWSPVRPVVGQQVQPMQDVSDSHCDCRKLPPLYLKETQRETALCANFSA